MAYRGVIIAESLADTSVLKDVPIYETQVEPVTEAHKTPWVRQWTMHTVEIPEPDMPRIAETIAAALDPEHMWYADFKNADVHYIVFKDKVFRIERADPAQYDAATAYGVALGIPAYQVDFSPAIQEWKR